MPPADPKRTELLLAWWAARPDARRRRPCWARRALDWILGRRQRG